MGRPRRGRRPRAYDDAAAQPFDLPPVSPSPRLPSSLNVSSTTALASPMPLQLFLPHLVHSMRATAADASRDFRANSPPPAHAASVQRRHDSATSKSRRKPKTTVRILSDEQRLLLESDPTGVQREPLNLGVAKAGEVLDLSRQKSDVESEDETTGERDWKDSCDEYEDEDPQDLSSRGTGNGNGFHAAYHASGADVKFRHSS